MVRGFNKDMERYLRDRKESKFSFRFNKPRKQEQVPVLNENEVTIEQGSKDSLWSRIFSGKGSRPADDDLREDERAKVEALEHDIESVEEAEAQDPAHRAEYEEAREGLLSQLFDKLKLFQKRHKLEDEAEYVIEAEEALEEEKERLDDDVKEVLKIAHKWLGKLTKRQREAFKESDDFKRYREILERYEVAKRKS